ncbi:MAG TPA: PEP-CTERM sorting domain-containing protein [Burkholderiaceae bacterium]|nr:PEP-CTERM sorting domain-containing protein [Burkholderiaceae bacterium]
MKVAHVRCVDKMARKSFHPLSLAVAMACAGWGTAAQAVDVVWFGGNGDWDVGGNWSTGYVPTGSDRAIVNAGTASLAVDYAVGGYEMTGGAITGAGNLAVSGAASWTGGSIGGYGGNLVSNGTLAISGSAVKQLGNYYGNGSSGVVNNAAATWSGSGNLGNYASGRFTNAASGSLDIQTDADFTGGTLVNQGTLTKSVGATDGSNMTAVTALFNNDGSVDVQQGVLSLQNGGAHTGSFTTGANGWIEFGGGYYSGSTQLNAGANVNGNIRIIAGSGTAPLNVNTGATYDATRTEIVGGGMAVTDAAVTGHSGAFTMTGGAITGVGNLAVSGAASWTGGSIGGYGGNLVSNGTLAISGSAVKQLGNYYGNGSSGVVNNAAATWSGSGNLGNYASGRFTNAASGSLDIQTDADFTAGTLINQGTLTKSFGASDGSNMTVVTGQFNNTGRVNVQQGVLEVTTPFNNQGVIDVAAAAQFHGNNAAFSNAGTIQGNGTVQTALNKALSNDGVISPGNGIGKLTIAGDLKADAAGSLKFELTSLASFDQLALTGDVTLGGDIGVWNLGYTPKLGDSFVVMTFDQRLSGTTFASLTTHGFAPGVAFETIYHDHDVTLGVTSIAAVPEPRTWLLMLAGIGVISTSLRQRRNAANC